MDFQTFPGGGRVGVENEINAISAFGVQVEVEAELGKNYCSAHTAFYRPRLVGKFD